MVNTRGGEVFSSYLHRLLSQLLRTHLSASAPNEDTQVPLDAVVEFATSTVIGLGARWWMKHDDPPCSPQEMDEIYHQLADPGIRAGLRPKT
jgi:hypothetical protein